MGGTNGRTSVIRGPPGVQFRGAERDLATDFLVRKAAFSRVSKDRDGVNSEKRSCLLGSQKRLKGT